MRGEASRQTQATIAVFDSGVGGLTVLRALRERLPGSDLLYLGDTARVPYGTKSLSSVQTYVARACAFFRARAVTHIVIACNTASAALRDPSWDYAGAEVLLDVVGPGARAVLDATRSKHIAVIGTEGTVRSEVYPRTIASDAAGVFVYQVPCQLFVALAEEGWGSSDIARRAAERYLSPLFSSADGAKIDALLLGCTHFPMLRSVIEEVVPSSVSLVDSAEPTARFVAQQIAPCDTNSGGDVRYYVSDSPERFRRIGEQFLSEEIPSTAVELVDF